MSILIRASLAAVCIACGSGTGPVGVPSVGGWEPPTGGIGGYESAGSGGSSTSSGNVSGGGGSSGGSAGVGLGGSSGTSIGPTGSSSSSGGGGSYTPSCGLTACGGTYTCNTGTVTLGTSGVNCVAYSAGVMCTASPDCQVVCSNDATGTIEGSVDGSFTVNLASYSVICAAPGGATVVDGGSD